MSLNIFLIILTIICVLLMVCIKKSCKCNQKKHSFSNVYKKIDMMNNGVSLHLNTPTELFQLYFPYIDTKYMDNKIISHNTNIDLLIQTIPEYEIRMFDILTDKKYDNIYKNIFDVKPNYHKLFNIFYAYMLNRKNGTFIKDTDVHNKYIIKRLFNDNNYLYLIPFTATINNVDNLPIITDYDMINTTCKPNNKYIPCKISIIPEPKEIIENQYYPDIINYYTSMIFVDILKILPIYEQYNAIILIEKEIQKTIMTKLKTIFIDTPSITTCNCA